MPGLSNFSHGPLSTEHTGHLHAQLRMTKLDDIAFHIAAFTGALFVLELDADKFIDNIAWLATRLNVSPTLIALLASGDGLRWY